jgi:CRP/FNR family transcriptional regulator, cyclic AMP receptor protein
MPHMMFDPPWSDVHTHAGPTAGYHVVGMSRICEVLLDDPDLGEFLRDDRRGAAIRASVAREIEVPPGPWSVEISESMEKFGIGLLVLEGLLLRRVSVAGRIGAELLGPGDLLRPWQNEDVGTTMPRAGGWRAVSRSRLAVLDAEFAIRIAPFPEITSALFGRAIRRSRHIAVNMAIVHHPRVWVRLHMLFWELADRWGRVGRDGIHVPVRLTHAMLADLVAARRPSVTKALGELASHGIVRWTGSDWLLTGDPPAELDVEDESDLELSEVETGHEAVQQGA